MSILLDQIESYERPTTIVLSEHYNGVIVYQGRRLDDEVCQLEKERDEARKEAEEWRDQYYETGKQSFAKEYKLPWEGEK